MSLCCISSHMSARAQFNHIAYLQTCLYVLLFSCPDCCALVWPCCRRAEGDQAGHFQPPLWAPGGEVSGRRRAGSAHPTTWRQVWQEHHETLTSRREQGRREDSVKGGKIRRRWGQRAWSGWVLLRLGRERGRKKRMGKQNAETDRGRKEGWILRETNWPQNEHLLTKGKRRAFFTCDDQLDESV